MHPVASALPPPLTARFGKPAGTSGKTSTASDALAHRQVDPRIREEREDRARTLQEALSRESFEGGGSPQPASGRGAMLLLRCVESDPLVCEAARNLERAEGALDQGARALAGGRRSLFEAQPQRYADLHRQASGWFVPSAAIGSVCGPLGAGGVAGLLLGPAAIIPTCLVGAIALLASYDSLRGIPDRIVEGSLRREVNAAVQRAQAELPGLRDALEATRDEALEYYTHGLEGDARPSSRRPAAPAFVVRDDAHVDLGGVRVAVHRPEPTSRAASDPVGGAPTG